MKGDVDKIYIFNRWRKFYKDKGGVYIFMPNKKKRGEKAYLKNINKSW